VRRVLFAVAALAPQLARQADQVDDKILIYH
jgi:hypothetical protein